MEFIYREGNKEDLDQLRALAILSYSQFEKVLTPKNWATLYRNLEAKEVYENILDIATCFVCELDDKIIGVAYLIPSGNPTDIFDTEWSYIRMVGVDPKFRGHSISKTLTLQCIERASQNGEDILALHTSEFMDAARHIYEGLGFKKIKEVDPIFGKRYWVYNLKLK